jgi:hypothetical protein
MVDAFNIYSTPHFAGNNSIFLLYLLGSFINISMYDFGTQHLLNKGLLASFNNILDDKHKNYHNNLDKGRYEQMRELILSILKNVTLIKDGKIEAISERLIYTVSQYLNSNLENERLYSSAFMMAIGSLLEAKKEICSYTNSHGKFEILEKICLLLEETNLDIKKNTVLCLVILSELPSGFLKIVDILYDKLTLLDEV